MLVTLEHNGTQEHIDATNELEEYIEKELGMTTQAISSHYSNEIFGFDEDGNRIFSIALPLNKQDFGNVHYILSMLE